MADDVKCGCGGTNFIEVRRYEQKDNGMTLPKGYGTDNLPRVQCANCHAIFTITQTSGLQADLTR